MSFMKAIEQAVREIKREVNLKVLLVPEIEQKVLDATDDEPWGPHGTVLAEIAQATNKYTECQMIMSVLWTRLVETGKNWRLVYKALTVIEYLVANGSERAVDDIIEHTYQINSLTSFEYVEPSGKDVGLNVRKKAETIVTLLNNKDKIQEARNKAAVNREKYVGLSSSGMTYKSAAASFSGSNFRNNDRYGGFSNTRDNNAFSGSFTYKDPRGDDKYAKTTKSVKQPSSKKQDRSVAGASKSPSKTSKMVKSTSMSPKTPPSSKYDEDFDDFDPRGTSSSKPSAGGNEVFVFGQNSADLLDASISPPLDNSTSSFKNSSEVDLFANVDFVFAPSAPQLGKSPDPQANVDLFASQPAPPVSTVDFFAAPNPVSELDNKAPNSDTTSNTFDPFASVAMNNFDGSMFSSHTDPSPMASGTPKDEIHEKIESYSVETKSSPKKEEFQVKSGIWADSLSRGLIDLNIAAPKMVNLADIGIVGGLTDGSEEKDKGPYMGQSMGVGKPGFTSTTTPPTTMISDDDFFSSLSSHQHQFGSFSK